MLLPPPIVIDVSDGGDFCATHACWTPYVDPAATWDTSALPVSIAWGNVALPGISIDDASSALDVARRAWMLPACTNASMRVVASRTPQQLYAQDGENDVIVHTADWPAPLEAHALAHTILYVSGARILEADVHVNATEWTFSIDARDGAMDLRSVLTHELGHVFGVGHSADPRASMSAGLPPGLAARSLEADDVEAICALYPSTNAIAKGCDVGDACPSSYACVGHDCEHTNESSILGGACDPPSSDGRCDAAGDTAKCVATIEGDRCTVACAADRSCGDALVCATLDDGSSACIPIGDSLATDAGIDAGAPSNDASPNPTASPSSGACAYGPEKPASFASAFAAFAMLTVLRLLRRLRTRPSPVPRRPARRR